MQSALSLTVISPPDVAEYAMAKPRECKSGRSGAANLRVRSALASDAMGAIRGGCECALDGSAMFRLRSGETRRDDSRERGNSGSMAE
jgi:hypothetical protein